MASFEPAGFRSPIGRYKEFAHHQQDHHFVPECHGGTVFRDGSGGKLRWIRYDDPRTPLVMALEDSICALERAVVGSDINYWEVQQSYPNEWGASATIIEVVPRFFRGLHGLIRMLPCIPPSRRGTPTCLLLRGLFNPAGEDYYGVSWDSHSDGFDPALFESDRYRGYFEDRHELIRAFNALAHARGLKTGFVAITNSGQVYIDGRWLDWNDQHHVHVFIGKCLNAISLGFDAIYFDSARHAGGWDHGGHYHVWDESNYHGQGVPIPYGVMQYITHRIRECSGRQDLAFFGEYTCQHERFREMGLNGGLFYDACMMSNDDVYWVSESQRGAANYKAGFFISNDNDTGSKSFDDRLGGAWRALKCQGWMAKAPVLFTQCDLWPLVNASFHDLVMRPIHWDDWPGYFHPDSGGYTWRMNEIFAEAV